MAVQPLSANFQGFFSRLNPGSSFEQRASSQHNTIRGLLEDRKGLATELEPVTFLQGSYRQQTAIYDINDVDVVALCKLWYPGSGVAGGKSYGRDEIFRIIAAPLLADMRYRDKVRYGPQSMCIKVDLGIQVEILPVVFKAGTSDPKQEPFALYRPEKGSWEDGFARYHQWHLSNKNASNRTQGNFIPMIKVLKHIRSLFNRGDVSFHIECLLYSLPDWVFWGEPASYIAAANTEIQNQLGHSNPAITLGIYSHWFKNAKTGGSCEQLAKLVLGVPAESQKMWALSGHSDAETSSEDHATALRKPFIFQRSARGGT